MELLYYWCADDRITINEQSFNFSSQFKFELNYSEKEFRYNLEIKLNEDYIENFFNDEDLSLLYGDNLTKLGADIVNVTTIVGENGVGKTNLLSNIIDLLTDNFPFGVEYIVAFKDQVGDPISVFYNLDKRDIGIENPNGLNINEPQLELLRETVMGDLQRDSYVLPKSEVISFSPAFDLRDYPPNISIENKKYIDISTCGLIENDVLLPRIKGNEDKILRHKYSNVHRYLSLSVSSLFDFNGIIIPRSILIIPNQTVWFSENEKRNLKYENYGVYDHLMELVNKSYGSINGKYNRNNLTKADRYKLDLENFKVKYTDLALQHFFYNANLMDYGTDIGVKVDKILREGSLQDIFLSFCSEQKIAKEFDCLYQNLMKAIDHIPGDGADESNFSINVNNTYAIEIMSNYEEYMSSFTGSKVDLINLDWRNISTGEKAFLDIYSRFYFAKSKLEESTEFIYLLIDEGEIGLHPEWQRDYLNKLITFLKFCFSNYSVQIILTTHSPIIISDLPTDNIIFLEKDFNGNCIVQDNPILKTFGANIHELFRDSFFLKDGLVGKFAYKKIQDLIKYIKGADINEKQNEESQKLINIIGEPILRNKLQEILNEHRSIDQKVKWHQAEIEKLNKTL